MSSFSGLLAITVVRAKELRNSGSAHTPYVTITIGNVSERTNPSSNPQAPEWNQLLSFPLNPTEPQHARVVVTVPFVEQPIGEATIPLSELISHAHQQRWYAIHDINDKNYSTGIIQLEVFHDPDHISKQTTPSTNIIQSQAPPSYAHATAVPPPQQQTQQPQQPSQPTYAQPPQQPPQPTYAQPQQPSSNYPGQVYRQQPQQQLPPPPAYVQPQQPQYQPPQYQQPTYQQPQYQPPPQPQYVYQQQPQTVVYQPAPQTVVYQQPAPQTVVVQQESQVIVRRPGIGIGTGVGTGLVAGAVLGSLFGGHHHHHHGFHHHHHHHRHHRW